MAGEWRETPLSDLTEPDTPVTYGVVKPGDEDADGVPFIRGGDIANGRVLTDQLRTISNEISTQYKRTLLRGGEIVMSLVGNPGQVAIVPESLRGANIARQAALIRLRLDVDSRFVMYFLGSRIGQEALGAHSRGSVQQVINLRDLKTVRIPLPPLPEQRAIAHILGTLDDKIELNRRMNETLEAMARALFQSWFVDFDPVRAKMEGRDPGLPKPLADLFPARLVDSELGEIPEGWEVKALAELIVTVKGRSYKSEELVESDTALVTLKSFARGGGYRPDGLKSFAGTYKPEQVVQPGELVIACTDVTQAAEVIGRPAIVRGTGVYRRLVASLDTLIVRPRNSSMTRSFLYFLGGTDAFVAHTYAHTTGTTVLHLAKEAVPSFKFARPSTQLVKQFEALAGPALVRIQALDEESGTLAALRDTLLPKLISGELRVHRAPGLVVEAQR